MTSISSIRLGPTSLQVTWHDNTENNPSNPDPRQWVGWGDRTVDEMAHAWVDVTYLEQSDYDRLIAERKTKRDRRTVGGEAARSP